MIPDSDVNKILNLLNGNNVTEISFSKKIEDFSKNNYNLDVIENIDILPNFENGVELKKVIKNIRKYFIENGYIESIILLPENILIHYPVSLALIVFSKKNQKIRFIDASKFYSKK